MKNSWTMAVAVVDWSGNLVYYERMDNTQVASAKVCIDKARTSAMYKRPSKAFQDGLAAGGVGCASWTCAAPRRWRAASRC